MPLIIKKFGGSSVADLDKIKFVADKIQQAHVAGDQLVIVVSALQGETDRLLALAHKLSPLPNPRELDVLLATGEQVTIALLSIALTELGCKVRSYTGTQVQIQTDQSFNKARILHVDPQKITADLNAGFIAVVAGFQGVDRDGNITTLGRGGSDTTAVALAAALKADECQIYTDVDGVYTADPRIVNDARRMDRITFAEMMELASLGAKVLQIRSVEIAGRYKVPLRVLSTFQPGDGTLISYEEDSMELHEIVGVAHSINEAKIAINGVPDQSGYVSRLLSTIAAANIEIDMYSQNVGSSGLIDLSFTISKSDLVKVLDLINPIARELNLKVFADDKVAKLSLVGTGLRSRAGIISKMLNILNDNCVHMQLISISEIKVSAIIDEKYIELAVRALHEAFVLDKGDILQTCQENADFLKERV